MILQTQLYVGNANRVLTPEFVQRKYNAFSSTTFSLTLDATPIQGNFMILTCGGSSIRTPTFDGSYTVVNLLGSGVSNYIAYKFAGAGESTTQTVTWNLSQAGSMQYYEFRNIDTVSPVVTGSNAAYTFGGAATSKSYPTYNVAGPSVYIPNLIFTNSQTWAIDNGFQIQPTVSRFFSAYKIYTTPTNGEVTTWSGTSADGEYSMIAFNGKNT